MLQAGALFYHPMVNRWAVRGPLQLPGSDGVFLQLQCFLREDVCSESFGALAGLQSIVQAPIDADPIDQPYKSVEVQLESPLSLHDWLGAPGSSLAAAAVTARFALSASQDTAVHFVRSIMKLLGQGAASKQVQREVGSMPGEAPEGDKAEHLQGTSTWNKMAAGVLKLLLRSSFINVEKRHESLQDGLENWSWLLRLLRLVPASAHEGESGTDAAWHVLLNPLLKRQWLLHFVQQAGTTMLLQQPELKAALQPLTSLRHISITSHRHTLNCALTGVNFCTLALTADEIAPKRTGELWFRPRCRPPLKY